MSTNLRMWHEASAWARLCFRMANWWLRWSEGARTMMVAAAKWHCGDLPAPRLRPQPPSGVSE
jgi:hypothetical protein